MGAPDDRLAAYAQLAVQVGLNLQPGQRLAINAVAEHAPLVRAVAAEAYRAGASFVDVLYGDQHVRRAHIEHASDDMLGWSPPWLVQRLKDLVRDRGALLSVTGNPEPEIFGDLDGARVARARMRELSEASLELTGGGCNWSIVAAPNEGWAKTVFGEPDLERLWRAVATAVRLDEPDPVGAWREHIENLERRAAALNERRFDSLRYRGPGTDLSVGLLPSRWWQRSTSRTGSSTWRTCRPRRSSRPRRPARRGHGSLDLPAPDPRDGRARPRGSLRGRPRGRGSRRRRRGADAGPGRRRRRRGAAR